MITTLKNKKYKYIFFDIFDTILSRKVEPEYVKKIWCNYIIKTFDLNLNMEDLYLLRNKIESDLGANNHNNGKDYEFIYEDMIKEIYNNLKIEDEYENFYKICEETEINIESKVLYSNEDILNIIKKLKSTKKIICVSDMYLSKKMIEKIFKNLDILKYFDDFFISCEYLYNKKSGILYDIVLKELEAKKEECIMIGDNLHSDYNMPKQIGIDAIHLQREDKYKFYNEFKLEKETENIYNKINKISKLSTSNFENCIFSLYRFIEKLYFDLIKNNKKEVFFLSREGEFLKKLFDYYTSNILNQKIESHYLYVSRKSTYLPSLKELNKEDFSSLLNQYSYITINEFLKSLNLTDKEITSIEQDFISKKINIDFNQKIENFKNSEILKDLKSNKTFIKIYETNRKEQKENFLNYIKEKTESKNISVVDIGWNGSIQNNIQNILGDSYKIDGYYFGLLKKYFDEKIEKKGLVFTNYPEESKDYYLYNENRTIFEIILGASHGSANKYIKEKDKIIVELFKKEEEEKIYKDVIKPLQDEMFNRFINIANILQNNHYNNIKLDRLFNKIHFNMVFNPDIEQYNFFNKIYHYENFGVFEFTEFKNKERITLKNYIKENLKFFLRYKTYFYDTYWPILKLQNKKLYIQKILYVLNKKRKFKKAKII